MYLTFIFCSAVILMQCKFKSNENDMSDEIYKTTEKLKCDFANFQRGHISEKEYDRRRARLIQNTKSDNKQRYGFAMNENKPTNRGNPYEK